MAVAIVIGVVVVVWLLWRIVQVQEVRARIEVAQLANNAASAASNAAPVANSAALERLGAFSEAHARANGKLIEFVSATAVHFQVSPADVRELLLTDETGIFGEVVEESFRRGIRCSFLEPEDFSRLHEGHPGPEPEVSACCSGFCQDELITWLPSFLTSCPFCGEAAQRLDPNEADDGEESERQEWERQMATWNRYRALYPERASVEEAERLRIHDAVRRTREEKFRRLLAEKERLWPQRNGGEGG